MKKPQRGPTQISVVMLHPSHRSYLPDVLIEGDKASLKHLASLILRLADDDDCGFHIGPRGPGTDFFTPYSEMGLYFHRLPCTNGEEGASAKEIAATNVRRRKRQLTTLKRVRAPRRGQST